MTGWLIGRFQPWHEGHAKCVEKILEECHRCIIIVKGAIRSKNNPYTSSEVKSTIMGWIELNRYQDTVDVQIIFGDSENMTVYYGRDVGWGFKEIRLDKKIEEISATKIRNHV